MHLDLSDVRLACHTEGTSCKSAWSRSTAKCAGSRSNAKNPRYFFLLEASYSTGYSHRCSEIFICLIVLTSC